MDLLSDWPEKETIFLAKKRDGVRAPLEWSGKNNCPGALPLLKYRSPENITSSRLAARGSPSMDHELRNCQISYANLCIIPDARHQNVPQPFLQNLRTAVYCLFHFTRLTVSLPHETKKIVGNIFMQLILKVGITV